MNKPTLEQEVRRQIGGSWGANMWCLDGKIESYPRVERKGVLSITNIKSIRRGRERNVLLREKYIRTGDFDLYLEELQRVAVVFGFYEVYFGGVCNEFLPAVLERKGFVQLRDPGFDLPHYSRFFNPLTIVKEPIHGNPERQNIS